MRGNSSCPTDTPDAGVPSGVNSPLISPDAAGTTIARSIRLACMRRHEIALKQLAYESGVSEARLRKFLSKDPETVRTPQLHEALSIWAVLGADAASASLSVIGMTAADEDDTAPALGAALADMLGGGARLARAAADGEIAAREADDAEHAADQVIEAAATFRRRARAARGTA